LNGSRLRYARIVCVNTTIVSWRNLDFEAGHTDRNKVMKEKTKDEQGQSMESFFAGSYFSMMMTG
jgi:hypothetical protein